MPTSGDASSHGRGRPRAAVTVEVIQGLLNKQYTLKEIAARFKARTACCCKDYDYDVAL